MELLPETVKKNRQITDSADIASHAPDVVSTPTLFSLDSSEIIDGTLLSSSLSQ